MTQDMQTRNAVEQQHMIYMYINLKFLLHVITLNDKSKTFSLKELWKSQVWCLGHGSWSIVHHLECPCLRYCFTKLFTFQVHKIHEVPSSIWSPCKTLTLDSWGLGFESYQVWCLGVGIPYPCPYSQAPDLKMADQETMSWGQDRVLLTIIKK